MMLVFSILVSCLLGSVLSYVMVDETEKSRAYMDEARNPDSGFDAPEPEAMKHCA